MSEQIETSFNEGVEVEIPVKLSPIEERKKRRREKLHQQAAEARAFEKFGVKIMKVKLRALSSIGVDIESLGAKNVGHGRIAVVGENAQQMIDRLDEVVHELSVKSPPGDPEVIIKAIALQKGLNELLLESGKAHINADKQVDDGSRGPHLSVPFPAGTPLVVGIAPQKHVSIENNGLKGKIDPI